MRGLSSPQVEVLLLLLFYISLSFYIISVITMGLVPHLECLPDDNHR